MSTNAALRPVHARILKHNLRRSLLRDVVSVESPINAVLLFLNGHRELLQRLVVEATVREDAGVLASQRFLVVLASEERNRLAALATTTWLSKGN